ncbi:hypothetical protein NC653_019060 [Populus alba x Populus x berolinensis]|uniref:H(+)-exporting diphosphatase n=2 Tax=Populus alba x Populus x berolinensis TaxID=444605 RepID=A0AAD6QHX0_9ROSI|nr:hypothetical protein NC653_019060 [Populus alba x Populus x berolinensis]
MYGIAVAVLVMLSTIATESAVVIYDSISDNFGGIIDIVGMSHCIRERTNALYAVGNTNATIGKEFTIGSATLVSMAFFGVCISNASISTVDLLNPNVFIGSIAGAVLMYFFPAMTLKGVENSALKFIKAARRQFNNTPGFMEGTTKPNYVACVMFPTKASTKKMTPSGALVMLTLLLAGSLYVASRLSSVFPTSKVHGIMPRNTMRLVLQSLFCSYGKIFHL